MLPATPRFQRIALSQDTFFARDTDVAAAQSVRGKIVGAGPGLKSNPLRSADRELTSEDRRDRREPLAKRLCARQDRRRISHGCLHTARSARANQSPIEQPGPGLGVSQGLQARMP
jgi:hypothetical protein